MKRIALCLLTSCLICCFQASGQLGIITTVAGGGRFYPGDGAPATAASLNLIPNNNRIVVDTAGNFFISDSNLAGC